MILDTYSAYCPVKFIVIITAPLVNPELTRLEDYLFFRQETGESGAQIGGEVMYGHHFGAAGCSGSKMDNLAGYLESAGQERQQFFIGPAFFRRRGHLDFEAVAMQARHRGFAGPWHDMQLQQITLAGGIIKVGHGGA